MTEIAEVGLERLAQEILAIPWFRYSPMSGAGQLVQSDLPDKFAMAVLEAHQPDPRVSAVLSAVELWLADFDDNRRDVELDLDHAQRFRALVASFRGSPYP